MTNNGDESEFTSATLPTWTLVEEWEAAFDELMMVGRPGLCDPKQDMHVWKMDGWEFNSRLKWLFPDTGT